MIITHKPKLVTRRRALKAFGVAPFIFGRTTFAPDPYTLTEYYPGGVNTGAEGTNAGNANANGRTQRNGALVSGQSTAVLVIFGQSNTCNVNPSSYTPANASVCDNFNIYDGGVYAATDPLLGCSTSTLGPGNPFLRLADTLITNSVFQRVILVPAGIGATTVAMWAADSYNRISVTFKRLAAAGLTATAVLYQQGETDCGNGTSQSAYAASLATFISTCRGNGYNGPIFIAESTWSGTAISTGIENAQIAAVTGGANGIWSLGNMDQNTTTWRQSGAGEPHLNNVGAAAWSSVMYTSLIAYGAPF